MSSPKEQWAHWKSSETGAEVLDLGLLKLTVGWDNGLGRKYVATSSDGTLNKSGFDTHTEAKKYAEGWARQALTDALNKIPLYWFTW